MHTFTVGTLQQTPVEASVRSATSPGRLLGGGRHRGAALRQRTQEVQRLAYGIAIRGRPNLAFMG